MTPEERGRAIRAAAWAAAQINSGRAERFLRSAAEGDNDDLLFAIHLIMKRVHDIRDHG